MTPQEQQDLILRVQNYGKKPASQSLMGDVQATTDRFVVSKFVELDKGCLLYLVNEAEPMRMASFAADQIRSTMLVKRFIPDYLRYIQSKGLIGRILLIGSLKLNYQMYRDYFYWALTDTYRAVDRYNEPVRELYRVIPQKWEKEKEIVCSILEHDMAYRFIFQDAVSNLNQKAFSENPYKEIKRLFDLVIERSPIDGYKFKGIYRLLSIYLRVNRKFVKELQSIVANLDLDAIKPSKEDIYWMYYNKVYNHFGLTTEQKMKKYHEIRNNYLNG